VPKSFETQDLVNSFNQYFHDGVSNVSVYKVVNIVYVIRKLITRRNAKSSPFIVTDLI
jgi:hypothetical protein